VRLRISQACLGSILSVGAAIGVTAQAFSMPPKVHRARDLVAADARAQAQFADVCQMYPAECRLNPDGSVARVMGRRIVPGADRAVLNHFRTEVGIVQEPSWAQGPSWDTDAATHASNNTND
jgi:hypothetical protein